MTVCTHRWAVTSQDQPAAFLLFSFILILLPRLFFIERGPSIFSWAWNLYFQQWMQISTLEQTIGNKTIYPQIFFLSPSHWCFFFPSAACERAHLMGHVGILSCSWFLMRWPVLVVWCQHCGSLWSSWSFTAWVENHRMIKFGKVPSRS